MDLSLSTRTVPGPAGDRNGRRGRGEIDAWSRQLREQLVEQNDGSYHLVVDMEGVDFDSDRPRRARGGPARLRTRVACAWSATRAHSEDLPITDSPSVPRSTPRSKRPSTRPTEERRTASRQTSFRGESSRTPGGSYATVEPLQRPARSTSRAGSVSVAAAVACRAESTRRFLDEVRLAVGDAFPRGRAPPQQSASPPPVRVVLTEEEKTFHEVGDEVPGAAWRRPMPSACPGKWTAAPAEDFDDADGETR